MIITPGNERFNQYPLGVKRIIVYVFALTPLVNFSFSQAIVLDQTDYNLNITQKGEHFVDLSGEISFDSVWQKDPGVWNDNQEDFIKFNRGGNGKVWYKYEFINPASFHRELYFELLSDLEIVEYFLLTNGKKRASGESGRSVKPSDLPIWYRNTTIPITMYPKDSLELYLSFDSNVLYHEVFTLKTHNEFLKDAHVSFIIDGVLYGLFVMLTIISVVIYLITRSRMHLFYSLYCTSNVLTFFTSKGDLQFFFFPNTTLGHGAQFILTLLTTLFFFRFLIDYYRSQGLSRHFNTVFRFVSIILLTAVILIFLDQFTSISFSYPLYMERVPMMFVSFICLTALGMMIYFLVNRPNWSNLTILLAFSFLLVFGAITVLYRNGYFPVQLYPQNVYGIGLLIELSALTSLISYNVFKAYSDRIVLNVELANKELELKQAAIIKKAHDEKDTLLREIHHRVKNNLQVISALLTLQSSNLKDAQAKTALQEGQDRVQSMALIHKDLYQHDNLKGVNTKDYLEQLIDNLLKSYNIGESDILLVLDIEEVNLDVDTMIPLGLMINELISNALKHAYIETSNCELRIKLIEERNSLKMTIADNGKGVNDINAMKSESFGYSLVQSFARKLNADISFESQKGLQVFLDIKNYKKV